MLDQIDRLPCSEREFALEHGDLQRGRRQHGLDMRRHVIGSFGIVAPSGVLGRQAIEHGREIVEHRGIGVFLNRQRRRGVTDEQCYRPFSRAGRLDELRDLAGEVDKAAAGLAATPEAGLAAATAVLTTDTVPKQATVTGAGWTVGGFAKGAGMVAPSLATMLCVLTTDAAVDGSTLDAVLRCATTQTFERLDIDGTCSTNDTVLLLASGASGVAPDRTEFAAAVQQVCHELVKGLQADAEGVSKEISITVRGADGDDDALTAARAIARDSLVKTAFFGSDANWGRIAAAVGASSATVRADSLDVRINGVLLCEGGAMAADRSTADLSGREIAVEVDLHLGAGQATVLTTDLSHAYVEENSAYSS